MKRFFLSKRFILISVALAFILLIIGYLFLKAGAFGARIIVKNESGKNITKLIIKGRGIHVELSGIVAGKESKSRFVPEGESSLSINGNFADGSIISANDLGYTTISDSSTHIFTIHSNGSVSYKSE